MAKKVTVYTAANCPYCMQAKRLLEEKKIPFENIDLTNDDAGREAIQEKTGWMTVPIILIGEELIGGFNELAALNDAGGLEAKIQSE